MKTKRITYWFAFHNVKPYTLSVFTKTTKKIIHGSIFTIRRSVGSASGQNDSTITGGSMDGLDPNTSCMSSKNCHVHAVVCPSSVPLPESGFFSSCSKQIEICIYENILALLTENHLNNTFIHLLERHCCPHTLYFFFKFSHFFDACWEVTFPSRPSSLISVLYHKYEE